MKSNVSEILEMMARIYRDATIRCSADVSDLRDLMTIRSRVKQEGLSFLTISLPAFCKEFERSLSLGRIDSTAFPGFRREKHGAIPAFLQGMLSLLFDRETGRLLTYEGPPDEGSMQAHPSTLVDSVRQICLAFKKIEWPCTPARERKAIENFKQVEHEVSLFSLPEAERSRFRELSFMLWSGMLHDFNHEDLLPKHGPGATAERVSGNQKYAWRYWHDRLEPFFPFIGTGYPQGVSMAYTWAGYPIMGNFKSAEEIENVTILPEQEEIPVRVTLVPKTQKTPRIIAIEPCCMQYAQQAVRAYLYRKLETWKYSAGSVNFRDQSANQRVALMSSSDGLFATIDLSDASDRVPRSMVEEMLWFNSDFLDCVMACRSNAALLPGGEVIRPLSKFASMGSALCFPVEAMYFFTIVVMALLEADNLPTTPKNLLEVTRRVYVYGDDIVVPSTNAEYVLERLQQYNCRPNAAKTFYTGKFRESCGVDAYDGYEVTPTYISHELPEDARQASQIASAVALANSFYRKGFWATAQFIRDRIEALIGFVPYVREDSEGLGWHSFQGWKTIGRWHSNIPSRDGTRTTLHRFEVRAYVMEPKRRTDVIDGHSGMAKSLLTLEASAYSEDGSDPFSSVQRGAVALKRRWVMA